MLLGDNWVHQQHTTRNYDVEVQNSIPFILVVDNIPHHVCCEQCSWKKTWYRWKNWYTTMLPMRFPHFSTRGKNCDYNEDGLHNQTRRRWRFYLTSLGFKIEISIPNLKKGRKDEPLSSECGRQTTSALLQPFPSIGTRIGLMQIMASIVVQSFMNATSGLSLSSGGA